MSKDEKRERDYWDCCTHCQCRAKRKNSHTTPCSRCQDID